MILELMRECRNFFQTGVRMVGTFSIENGALHPTTMWGFAPYIAIVGSAYSSGVYALGEHGTLTDDADNTFIAANETFTGTVYALAPPRDFLRLASDIAAWREKNPETNLASESYPNYSYSVAQGANGPMTWKDAFAARIAPFRRMFKGVPL